MDSLACALLPGSRNSGGVHAGRAYRVIVQVSRRTAAKPKSVTLMPPYSSTSKLEDLSSPWMMPRA